MSDEEIQVEMTRIYKAQQICLKIQIVLIFITIIAFLYGFVPLLLNFLLTVTWGIYLRNKATSLAKRKYPNLGLACTGKGFSWDPPIMNEAKRRNDPLTYKILAFNWWSMLAAFGSFFGYIFMITIWPQIMTWAFEHLSFLVFSF